MISNLSFNSSSLEFVSYDVIEILRSFLIVISINYWDNKLAKCGKGATCIRWHRDAACNLPYLDNAHCVVLLKTVRFVYSVRLGVILKQQKTSSGGLLGYWFKWSQTALVGWQRTMKLFENFVFKSDFLLSWKNHEEGAKVLA